MITIRYAKADDYELMLKIDSSIDKISWEGWTKNKQAVFVFDGKSLAGWLQYSFFIEKIPFVNRLYLFDNYQRQGLGTGLIKFWESEMFDRGYKKLMLSTEQSNTAQEFYKKLGYKILGSFDYFGEHTELILGKEIKEIGCCHKNKNR